MSSVTRDVSKGASLTTCQYRPDDETTALIHLVQGARFPMTDDGPDFTSPWFGSRPPTWSDWVKEGQDL